MFETFAFGNLLRAQGIDLISLQYIEPHSPGAKHVCCKPVEYSLKDGSWKNLSREIMGEITKSLRFLESKAEVSRLSNTLYVRVPR